MWWIWWSCGWPENSYAAGARVQATNVWNSPRPSKHFKHYWWGIRVKKQSEEDAIHIESWRRSQSSILMKHLPHSGNILSIFQTVETSTTFRGNPVNIYGPHSPPMYMLIQSLLYFQQGGSGTALFWEESMDGASHCRRADPCIIAMLIWHVSLVTTYSSCKFIACLHWSWWHVSLVTTYSSCKFIACLHWIWWHVSLVTTYSSC
jgi:hypothetical protein